MNPTLTRREREVLKHVADGRENEAIAAALGLSPSTVRTHLQKAYIKIGAANRAHAAAIAVRRGVA